MLPRSFEDALFIHGTSVALAGRVVSMAPPIVTEPDRAEVPFRFLARVQAAGSEHDVTSFLFIPGHCPTASRCPRRSLPTIYHVQISRSSPHGRASKSSVCMISPLVMITKMSNTSDGLSNSGAWIGLAQVQIIAA